MKGCFIKAKDILAEVGYSYPARLIPDNIGMAWNPNTPSNDFRRSWLVQRTSGMHYNDVYHMKVSAPVSNSIEFRDKVVASTYDSGYNDYEDLQVIVDICIYTNFKIHTCRRLGGNTTASVIEVIYGEVISAGKYHCYLDRPLWGDHIDLGVYWFPVAELEIQSSWELPLSQEFYSRLWGKAVKPIPDQEKFDVFSKTILALNSSVNNLENAESVIGLIKLAINPKSAIFSAIKDIDDFMKKGLTKKASKAWLAYRYQYATTMSDLQSTIEYYTSKRDRIINEIYSIGNSRTLRAGAKIGIWDYNFQFQLAPKQYYSKSYTANTIMQLYDQLYVRLDSLGINPTLKNLWDIVPLSFVLDWIIPIGDYLEKCDDERFLDAFDITFFGESCKGIVTVNWHSIPITISVYDRQLTQPPSGEFMSTDPSTSTNIRRVVDGAALLVSK